MIQVAVKRQNIPNQTILGIITNMTALPLTKLYFGGLNYDVQSGAFLLGRLKCYGKELHFLTVLKNVL